jgi:adenylate cyclase
MEDNKIVVEEHDIRNFDLTSFARAKEKMIATNEQTYKGNWDSVRHRMSKLKEYTPEEVA